MESILFSIQQQLTTLTKTEQRLAKYVLAQPQLISTMTTSELASAADVSAATVARFGKTICGQGGFPALKLRLSSEKKVDQSLFDEINPTDTTLDLKNKLTFRINQAITETNKRLENEYLEISAAILHQKETIFIYGLGASNIAAEDLQQKLLRVGKPVVQSLDTHLIAAALSAQKTQAVLVLVSNSGEKEDSIQLAKLAKSLSIPIIVLTHNAQSRLAKLATVALQHDDSAENSQLRSAATTSLIAQLYAVDLLYYSFLEQDFQANMTQLTASHQAINEYFTK